MSTTDRTTSSTATAHTRERLAADLRRLGLEAGDTVFVHASFKSLGPIEGDAGTVIGALEDALGPEGLLLMPAFNLGEGDRAARWDPATTRSSVGWLTEYFRQMPGTVRSDHYSHSVAARGRRAERIVADHRRLEGPPHTADRAPWGATYGKHSPMHKAYDLGGKYLFLGTGWETATYCHFVEAHWLAHKQRTDPDAGCDLIFRQGAGAYYESLGRVRVGYVGDAECRLMNIRDFVDTLLAAVIERPHRFVNVWNPEPGHVRRVSVPESAVELLRVPVSKLGSGEINVSLRSDGRGTARITCESDGDSAMFLSTDAGQSWQRATAEQFDAALPTSHEDLDPCTRALADRPDHRLLASVRCFDEQTVTLYHRPGDAGPRACARVFEPGQSNPDAAPEFVLDDLASDPPARFVAAAEIEPLRVLTLRRPVREGNALVIEGEWLRLT